VEARAIGPSVSEKHARFGGHPPMLGILERVKDENADDLPHRRSRVEVTEVRFIHRETERVFDRNGELIPCVLVVHKTGAAESAAAKAVTATQGKRGEAATQIQLSTQARMSPAD